MQEIIKRNFIDLVNKYERHVAWKKRQGVLKARAMLTVRFMKLYKAFRLKKYGEEPPKKSFLDEFQLPQELQDAEGLINSKLNELEKYLNIKKDDDLISDLHTVNEEYDEEDDDNPAAFVHNQEEYAGFLHQVVL